jgi:hypothetical protein
VKPLDDRLHSTCGEFVDGSPALVAFDERGELAATLTP